MSVYRRTVLAGQDITVLDDPTGDPDAAWLEPHRSHRVSEDNGCIRCHTCGLTYWRRRKP